MRADLGRRRGGHRPRSGLGRRRAGPDRRGDGPRPRLLRGEGVHEDVRAGRSCAAGPRSLPEHTTNVGVGHRVVVVPSPLAVPITPERPVVTALDSASVHHHARQLVPTVARISNRAARWLCAIRRQVEHRRDRDRRVEFPPAPSLLVECKTFQRQDQILRQGRERELPAAGDEQRAGRRLELEQVVLALHALHLYEVRKARAQSRPHDLERQRLVRIQLHGAKALGQ